MPILIDKDLPAYNTLTQENIFVMNQDRALSQDIRPIEIAILNLMPTKQTTETQLMRLLSNSPLQVNITLISTASYRSRHTDEGYLDKFYRNFNQLRDKHFDGMIITGAPVENLEFSQVKYWKELEKIFDFTQTNVTSTIFICWGAQAALNYFYGIEKRKLDEKLFGVFRQFPEPFTHEPLLKGMDDSFFIPHSRYSESDTQQLEACDKLTAIARFADGKPSMLRTANGEKIFLFGHMEYDRYTLREEYRRDLAKGLKINRPENYFADNRDNDVIMSWASVANIFYSNWLNYCVYQLTPYDLNNKDEL